MLNYSFTIPKVYNAGLSLKSNWYVEFYFTLPNTSKKKRFKIKGGINSYKSVSERKLAAELLCNEVYNKLVKGWNPIDNSYSVNPAVGSTLTCQTFFNDIMQYKMGYMKNNSIASLKYHVKLLLHYLSENGLLLVHPQMLNSSHYANFLLWLNQQNLSNRTRNNVLLTIKSLYTNASVVYPHIEIVNPVSKINPIKYASNKNMAYNDYTFTRIINAIRETDPLLHRFCRCFIYLGIRPHEACYIKIGDIDFVARTVTINAENNKTAINVVKPIFNIHWPDFEPYQQYSPNLYLFTAGCNVPGITQTTRDYFSKRFKKIKAKLGLNKNQTMYAMRHTFLINLFKSGVGYKDLMKITGHKTLSALQVYLQTYFNEPVEDISNKISVPI